MIKLHQQCLVTYSSEVEIQLYLLNRLPLILPLEFGRQPGCSVRQRCIRGRLPVHPCPVSTEKLLDPVRHRSFPSPSKSLLNSRPTPRIWMSCAKAPCPNSAITDTRVKIQSA